MLHPWMSEVAPTYLHGMQASICVLDEFERMDGGGGGGFCLHWLSEPAMISNFFPVKKGPFFASAERDITLLRLCPLTPARSIDYTARSLRHYVTCIICKYATEQGR